MDATDILDALGGPAGVAAALQMGRTTIYHWYRTGIPPHRCTALTELAKARGRHRAFRDASGARQPGITLERLMTAKPRPRPAAPPARDASPSPRRSRGLAPRSSP